MHVPEVPEVPEVPGVLEELHCQVVGKTALADPVLGLHGGVPIPKGATKVGLSHSNEDGGLAGSDPEIHLAGFRTGACGGSSCPAGMPSKPKTLIWYLLYMLGVTYPCSSLSLLSWGPLVPLGGLLSCIVSDLHFRRGMRLPHFVYGP